LHRNVRFLSVDVDDVAMDDLVETPCEAVVLTLLVGNIVKMQGIQSSTGSCPSAIS